MSQNKAFVGCLLICILFFACNSQKSSAYPPFDFVDMDSLQVGVDAIKKDKPFLLIYFRSDCDHCQKMALTIRETVKSLNTQIWMVSAENIEDITLYEDMNDLYDQEQIRFLKDYKLQMHEWYNFSSVPFIVLYNEEGKHSFLLDQFPDQTILDSLMQ